MTRMQKWAVKAVAAALVVSATLAVAEDALSPIEMQGDYIWTAVGVDGTLGVGEYTTPGLIHDPSGMANFDPDTDYVTPGTPFEGFSVSVGYDEILDARDIGYDTRTIYSNNNDSPESPDITPVSLEDVSATSEYDNHVVWTGTVSEQFNVTHEFFFNDGDERINIITRIEALDELGNVMYQRIVDPDPDVGIYSTFDTRNTRGYDANNDGDYNDSGDIPPASWVFSEGTETGRTLSLYTDEEVPHNTSVDSSWSEDPADTLEGTSDGDGDNTIALAFDIGDMEPDAIAELMYAYVMGATIEDILDDEFGISKKASRPHVHLMAKAGMRAVADVLAGRGRSHGALRMVDQPDAQGWVIWGRQIGVNADKDEDDGIPGYDAEIYHSFVGMEKNDGGYVGGLAFGIGEIEVDMDTNDESETDVYSASVYGSYVEEVFYIDGSFVYGFHDTEEVYPGRNSHADFDAHVYTLNLAIGQEYPITEWLWLVPEIGGMVMYYDQEDYDESGASNRSVDSFDTFFYESSVGISAKMKKTLTNGVVIQPIIGVAWLHEFNDDEEEIDWRSRGTRGLYRLQAPEDDLLQATATLSAMMNERVQIEVGVTYEQGDEYSSFGLGGAIGVAF